MRAPRPMILLVATLSAQALGCSLAAADQAEMFDGFMPFIRPLWLGSGAGARYEPSADTDDGPATFRRSDEHVYLRVQPYASATDELTVGGTGAETHIGGGAALPDTGPIPDHLYRIEGSLGYRHIDGAQRVYGLNLAIGSASDKPFANDGVLSVSATASARLSAGGDNAWLLFLNYANDRQVLNNVPLPGFGYLWKPDATVIAMVGLPFAFVSWRPTPWFNADVAVSGLGSAHLLASVKPLADATWLRVHVGYDWRTESFKRADRPDRSDQLFFREMTAVGGLTVEPGPWFSADLYGGWAFERQVFEDKSIAGHHDDLLRIDPGPLIGLELKSRF